MLEHTFCHIPGIGPKSERKLWNSGIHSWREVCDRFSPGFLDARTEKIRQYSEESMAQLEMLNASFFDGLLPSSEKWRVFSGFSDSVAYLDIETTGLEEFDHITVITLYDGTEIRQYVHERNLERFADDIRDYKVIVSFNGKTFDVPFIRRALGIPVDNVHIDLRYPMAALGLKGGLKRCEKKLGIERRGLEDVDGWFAVLLWRDFRDSGNERALETLMAYNAADTVNLAVLMAMVYNMKLDITPFPDIHRAPVPALPELPFEPCSETIDRIRTECGVESRYPR